MCCFCFLGGSYCCFVFFLCFFLVRCFGSFDFVADVCYDDWWIVRVLFVGLERLFVVSTGVTGGLKSFVGAFFSGKEARIK